MATGLTATFEPAAEFHSGDGIPRGQSLREGVSVVVCTYRRPESLARFLRSLWTQEGFVHPVLVIDASPDDLTERSVIQACLECGSEPPLTYYRVQAAQRGLTKQRNIALKLCVTDLIAYFDDDVELLTPCVTVMEGVIRKQGMGTVGVSPTIENQMMRPPLLWRIRKALAIVSSLQPGRYEGSGFSIPWGFASKVEFLESDCLPGAAMLWRTSDAKAVGFCERLNGYGLSEDLEFSIHMGRRGKLIVCDSARLNHWHEPAGREDAFRLGYMEIHNRYLIHRLRFRQRRALYIAWFAYAWSLDTLLLTRSFRHISQVGETVRQIAGRTKAAWDLLSSAHNQARLAS